MEQPRAKKSLGQNFLTDRNIARKIVQALDIAPGDRVLEIGPGPGALTGLIAEQTPGYLLLVEKDGHWAVERHKAAAGGVRPGVVIADALTLSWERFAAPWKVVGNLPYNIASPLMWDMFSRMPGLVRAVFMIQKEVGQRLTAQPGTSAYGALTVWTRTFVRPKLEFIVPPQVFIPRPKVDSAVVSFAPLAARDIPGPAARAALADLVHRCFQQRRKQLGTILRGIFSSEALRGAGVDPALRPESLAPREFLLLAERLPRVYGTASR